MWKLEDEDIIHFLLKCPLLDGSRQERFRRLKTEVINDSEDGTGLRIFNNEERITTLIIDCRNYSETLYGTVNYIPEHNCSPLKFFHINYFMFPAYIVGV
jgi:hypothetical protein